LQVMQSTRLGQGAKFFRAEECRDQHGRLQPAPPIVLGPMAPGSDLSQAGAKTPGTKQVRAVNILYGWRTGSKHVIAATPAGVEFHCVCLVAVVPGSAGWVSTLCTSAVPDKACLLLYYAAAVMRCTEADGPGQETSVSAGDLGDAL
jgi:hypothetical protein